MPQKKMIFRNVLNILNLRDSNRIFLTKIKLGRKRVTRGRSRALCQVFRAPTPKKEGSSRVQGEVICFFLHARRVAACTNIQNNNYTFIQIDPLFRLSLCRHAAPTIEIYIKYYISWFRFSNHTKILNKLFAYNANILPDPYFSMRNILKRLPKAFPL